MMLHTDAVMVHTSGQGAGLLQARTQVPEICETRELRGHIKNPRNGQPSATWLSVLAIVSLTLTSTKANVTVTEIVTHGLQDY
jgi:hypothetical protein